MGLSVRRASLPRGRTGGRQAAPDRHPLVMWSAVLLCVVQGGYMLLDGGRALVVGSYLTPSSGEHAGQLGPWARLVALVGIEPESTGMRLVFVVLGVLWLVLAAAVAVGRARRTGMALAICTLWYLVPGTVISLCVLLLLAPGRRRRPPLPVARG
jgi:hypothetical protein